MNNHVGTGDILPKFCQQRLSTRNSVVSSLNHFTSELPTLDDWTPLFKQKSKRHKSLRTSAVSSPYSFNPERPTPALNSSFSNRNPNDRNHSVKPRVGELRAEIWERIKSQMNMKT